MVLEFTGKKPEVERTPEKLAALRRAVAACGNEAAVTTVPLGFGCADAVLNGGLRCATLHEVYAQDASHEASATGFALGFAARLAGQKPIFWIGTEFSVLQHGNLYSPGLSDLGLDPARFFVVQVARGDDALRAAGDVLACASAGTAILEVHGKLKALDLSASRRLALRAAHYGVAAVLLRISISPQASAGETRWLVHAAASPPPDADGDWGAPRFDVRLIRNRHGQLGGWHLEWNCNGGFFVGTDQQRRAQDTRHLVAAPADRSFATPLRRAV